MASITMTVRKLLLLTSFAVVVLGLQPPSCHTTRRWILHQGINLSGGTVALLVANPAGATSRSDLFSQLLQAQTQLEQIPPLIQAEKWDSIRAILIEPPLADCWAKTNRPLVAKFAEELGNRGGDELAALEAREELTSHLRYLDMAVYNNVFNPITVEGKSGATKELIRSYYEDPINEFKASNAALQDLIGLGGE